MKNAMKRLENLKNYTGNTLPFRTKMSFYMELDEELDSFVGSRKEIKEKEAEIDQQASKMFRENESNRRAEIRQKTKQFKDDLALVNGLTDHPMLDKLWEKAWEQGYSYGLLDVKDCFEDLMELLS